ncbi:hypothetical protein B7C42_08306 [Nocardia cerradoensis]|uniref:Uncharacterized protein n=1 Tax=Nocardia cerradoensis TaxID=85688 RepID=A0A231GSM8_9NOCA|nr:hypothetical protein B7C42_08306 [Nocardia cerradoensis]
MVAHHARIGCGPGGGAEQEMRGFGVRHPISHGLGHRGFQAAIAGTNGAHIRPEQAHPHDVALLPGHIVGAHVDHTRQSEHGADGRHRDAVLPCPGFGDDAGLAHPHGQQRLPERVVDLVGAGVRHILALEEHPHPGHFQRPREPRRRVQQRRPADALAQQPVEFTVIFGIRPGRSMGVLHVGERRHQSFGNVSPAEGTESTGVSDAVPSSGVGWPVSDHHSHPRFLLAVRLGQCVRSARTHGHLPATSELTARKRSSSVVVSRRGWRDQLQRSNASRTARARASSRTAVPRRFIT